MVSTFRQGITAYGLAILAFTVPGLAGVVLGGALGWSSITQDAMFGIGLCVFLAILFLVIQYGTPPVGKDVRRLWAVAGVGIFAGVYCFVEADNLSTGSGGRLPLRVLGAILVAVPSLVPVSIFAVANRGTPPAEPSTPVTASGISS